MSNTQYHSLNEAANNASVREQTRDFLSSPESEDAPAIEVWYAINPDFSGDGMFEPFDSDMGPTHAKLGEVEYRADWQSLYGALQGDFWSPNGEARSLIMSKGLRHTSMSVGDVLVVRHPDRPTETWMCANTGWRQL
tara:strand:- start:301 stop:711 length:411 start_codon:yes stop_codon:yes gene_type:complete